MADIQPFNGLRPRPDLVQKVASPPYDVLNSKEAKELATDNPYSYLRVVKAEINFDNDIDSHSEEVYQKSSEVLQNLAKDGVLIQNDTPCYYIYEITMGNHTQRGLMIGASVEEYDNGLIKKHEFTRPDKEDDRAHHVDVLNANTGPVMLCYPASVDVDTHFDSICSTDEPTYSFTADDGIKHVMWVVSNPEDVEKITNNFKNIEAMYVADGHHRSAAAFRVRNARREKNPNHTGNELYNYFLAVTFPDNQLQILGYHRAVKDLNDLTPEELRNKLSVDFDVSETTDPEPKETGHFTMYLDNKWYSLTAKEGTFAADDPVESLDVAILQKNVLEKVLNLFDIRTNTRIDFIGGIRGTKELEKRCNEDMKVAFALYPTSVNQLMSVADSGEVMPPKSTWFEPKLRSGMVTRSLEEK